MRSGGIALIIALVAVVIFAADFITKWLVQTRMTPGESISVIPHVFSITYIRNAGAAFGILQRQTVLFVVITCIVILLILTYGRRVARGWPAMSIALGLQLGGALGNLLDRLMYGRVIDFIDIHVWPFVFNIADSAIVVGGILFAVLVLRQPAGEEVERN